MAEVTITGTVQSYVCDMAHCEVIEGGVDVLSDALDNFARRRVSITIREIE